MFDPPTPCRRPRLHSSFRFIALCALGGLVTLGCASDALDAANTHSEALNQGAPEPVYETPLRPVGGSFRQARLAQLTSDAGPNDLDASTANDGGADAQPPLLPAPEGPFFTLAEDGRAVPLLVDDDDFAAVARIAQVLAEDIERASGAKPEVVTDAWPNGDSVIVAGTLGESAFIDELVASGKLDVTDVDGRFETFVIESVADPASGLDQALVIAGSDKRGTLFGMLEVSRRFGTSPWVFWADVPPPQQALLQVPAARHTLGEPKVKYRGIFLNDEAPALSGWVDKTYGGFNAEFYEDLYVLMLRMKANYLWPAMWGKAFALDDPDNHATAHELGIVIGTSHHEPMLCSQEEWHRTGGTSEDWNYEDEEDIERLHAFWREGAKRAIEYETIVTVGMRGDGDEALTSDPNVGVLEGIVNDQRAILEEVTGRPAAETPQLWALYKEVLDYWDEGMEVPEDITMMFADDNWGNVRRLPLLGSEPRAGGYGMYYHYDYVGGPRSYKWLNTNALPRVWEQMTLAYAYGIDRIWLVNVGDLKPMELPTQFFLDLAYDPEAIGKDDLLHYQQRFAAEQFGLEHAEAIGEILALYAKYNARRKPELLSATTYNQVNFQEAERVAAEYNALALRAEEIYEDLPASHRDAYFQLVLYPVKASANLNEMYYRVGQNRLYADQGRVLTSSLAERAEQLFERDADYAYYYNHVMADGKWVHMMDQAKIGFSNWQAPDVDTMPLIETLEPLAHAALGVAVEGSVRAWDEATGEPLTLSVHRYQRQLSNYIDVFNRGATRFDFTIESDVDWVQLDTEQGTIDDEQRVWLSVDWDAAPRGMNTARLTVTGADASAHVDVVVDYPEGDPPQTPHVEAHGYLALASSDYTRSVAVGDVSWTLLPDHGRTGDAMTPFPVTAPAQDPTTDAPRLEYDVHLFGSGDVRVHLYASPTQTIQAKPLRVATSFDNQAPVVVEAEASLSNASWENSVRDNIEPITISHSLDDEGAHTLKLWMVDPGIVIQKIVIQRGSLPVSYLGPPTETYAPPQIRDVGPLAIGASGEGDATDATNSDNASDGSDDSSATTAEGDTSGDAPAGGDASDLPADDTSSARRNQLKGCNCTIGERSSSPPWWVLSAAVGLLYVQRRRARSST